MELPARDISDFRSVMANYPTGVVVITAIVEDLPVGMVVGSFTSISLEPFKVGYFPSKGSQTFETLRSCATFAVNVLSADQEALCRRFATRKDDKFDGVSWQPGPGGAPLIDGALAWIECSVDQVLELGDHYLVVGQPTMLEVGSPNLPLMFFQGAYGKFSAHPKSTAFSSDPWTVARRMALIPKCLEELARNTGADVAVVAGSRNDLWVASTSERASSVKVGARIPLVSPVASILVSPDNDAQLSSWLAPYEVSNEASRRVAMTRLARAHHRGFSLALEDPATAQAMYAGWAAYSSELRTPNEERQFRQLYEAMAHLYEPEDGALCGEVRIRSLIVPIGATDIETTGLRLSGIDEPVTRKQIEELAGAMVACAAEIDSCWADEGERVPGVR